MEGKRGKQTTEKIEWFIPQLEIVTVVVTPTTPKQEKYEFWSMVRLF
ncbi:MAG: hypothetical protein F6K39_18490 [Okeania sp. SIO3B3]|nr:hypothetical protein [Okeania sp. SIO3B3]